MGDRTTVYSDEFGINTFKYEICKEVGDDIWLELIKDSGIPDMDNEAKCGCQTKGAFMERFDQIIDKQVGKKILSKVRHGLKPSQCSWAREEFLKCKDLDAFNQLNIQKGIDDFTKLRDTNKDFYGQPITDEVLALIKKNPAMLAGIREGNKMYLMAFPAQMKEYVEERDSRKKRYYACHCPFAKESILSDKSVSKTLCNCSFGHVKNFWEAVFDRELEGEVVSSALNGDELCKYVVYLPEDIMEAYVK